MTVLERPSAATLLAPNDSFARRHLGPSEADVAEMLKLIGAPSLDTLIDETVPSSIRLREPLRLPEGRGESETLNELRSLALRNQIFRSFLGMGYSNCLTPPVIQ